MLEKPACRRAAQDLREDRGPPLRTMVNVAAKKVGRNRPGGRRAGCPHPAGPRGGANVSILKLPWCGGRERPPYRFGKTRRPPRRIHAAARSPGRIWNPPLRPRAGPVDNRETTFPRHAANLVVADARIGPGNPAAPQTPCEPWQTLQPKGLAVTTRAAVGRDALIPPGPAAARTFPF